MTALALDRHRLRSFFSLTKPRVVSLIVFTAMIGMFLAVPGLPPLKPMLFGTLGIALVAAAAAAINCFVEQRRYSDRLSRQTFGYSIAYLAALFSALLFDHYWK